MSGKTFQWCAKCRHWSTTHSTNKHVGLSKDGGTYPAAQLALDPLAWQPSAWLADVAVSTAHDSWDLFSAHFVPLLVGCYLTPVPFCVPLVVVPFWRISPFGWTIAGPLLWVILLALALGMKWVCPPPPPDPELYLHHTTPTMCNMHYHKSYPRCLQTPGHYFCKASNIDIQAAQQHLNNVQAAAFR